MAKKLDRPLEKVTLRIYEGDSERLRALYPSSGMNRVVRELIHRHLQAQEARFAEHLERSGESKLPAPDIS